MTTNIDRAMYQHHRRMARAWAYTLKTYRQHADMADSRLVVQIEQDHESQRSVQKLIDQHVAMLPKPTDPKGFRAMAQQWAERRKRVEYTVRARKRAAEQQTRHDARYGGGR